jgi:hypothetical protein
MKKGREFFLCLFFDKSSLYRTNHHIRLGFHQNYSREFFAHILERMTADKKIVVNNQPNELPRKPR